MKTLIATAAIAVGISGCGGTAAKVSSDPKVRAQEAKVQAKVQKCAKHANFITKTGRKAFYTCVTPNKASEQCAQNKVSSGSFLTKNQRAKLVQEVAGCLSR